MKPAFSKILFTSSLLIVANQASAAAFQLAEISTSGLGRAYAGEAAIGDNASAVATNPALMSLFKRPEVSAGGVYINPGVNLQGSYTYSIPAYGRSNTVNADYSDAIASKFIPNAYVIYPINDKFAIGGGVNVNYGLATEYDDNYSAGLMGGTTDLTAINMNVSGSYRFNQHWSFGLGFNAVYADAALSRRAGALGSLIGLKADNYLTDLSGDDWGFGWNAGVLYEVNENHRFGLAYHSKIKISFDGSVSSDLANSSNPMIQSFAKNGAGYVDLTLPDYVEFSGYHRLSEKFALHYSYKYTKWSRVSRLQAFMYNGGEAFNKTENFKDTSRYAIGASYDWSDKLTLRAGIAYDESAAHDYTTISIPDTDRMWYSLGATYKFTPDFSVDFAYAYVKGKTKTFTESESVGSLATVNGNFTSRSQINLYGINLNYRF
ncbi:outer membrane protein transport protein [Pasteurellaceae bacterium LIM206]|nr:outer membrane protein transport protein [Pasteurellaceae bacterium LIM206]